MIAYRLIGAEQNIDKMVELLRLGEDHGGESLQVQYDRALANFSELADVYVETFVRVRDDRQYEEMVQLARALRGELEAQGRVQTDIGLSQFVVQIRDAGSLPIDSRELVHRLVRPGEAMGDAPEWFNDSFR